MALLNYTTKIEVEKTIGEIQKLLGSHGAKAIMTSYENGVVSALSFQIPVNDRDVGFRLPCDWRPILQILTDDPHVPGKLCEQGQAVRVAWRIVKSWVEAQMALVDTMMVRTEEVFLPYAIMRDNKTLAEHMVDSNFQLPSGK